jgi:uncharacterized protein YciI
MTFLVIARDGTDREAKARRLAVRDQHLAGVQESVASGMLKMGGALLDDDAEMIGSGILIEAESKEVLETFLKEDIYSQAGVWLEFEIYPFKRAV